jgi:hypothetical protein
MANKKPSLFLRLQWRWMKETAPLKFFLLRAKIRFLYGKALQKYKDKHLGGRCFIIGNGPSLKITDLEKLKNEATFATNKIFLAFEETSWRPTYYCSTDPMMIIENAKIIEHLEAVEKFIAISLYSRKRIQGVLHFPHFVKTFYPNYPEFSSDISYEIVGASTVTYTAIQIAAYMGFREIYLLGVDFNYPQSVNARGDVVLSDVKAYFTEKYMEKKEFGKDYYFPNLECGLLDYKKAKEYADGHGIKIYNATRGGKLEVFPRVDFDSIKL